MRLQKRLAFLFILLALQRPCFAQKTIDARGEYQMRVEHNVTWDDAVSFATVQAQVNAIENSYGRAITQDNATFIRNNQDKNGVQTQSTFNFISNSYVRGEWVEDIDEPKVEKILIENEYWVNVKVHGKIRPITMPDNEFESFTMSCPDIKCQTRSFNDGGDLYLYFKSAKDGYVAVYLTDPSLKYTFQLLPYKTAVKNKTDVAVIADHSYIFFSKPKDELGEPNKVDEQAITVDGEAASEQFQVWVLFAPTPLVRPVLDDDSLATKKFLDPESIKQGYTLPKGIDESKFRKWLQGYRAINSKVQSLSLFIDVKKR